jgi:hypothetical protein
MGRLVELWRWNLAAVMIAEQYGCFFCLLQLPFRTSTLQWVLTIDKAVTFMLDL